MWIRNHERNTKEVLDWVEINGSVWIEVPDKKGVENVFAKNRARAGKKAVSIKNELCKLGNKQAHDRDGK